MPTVNIFSKYFPSSQIKHQRYFLNIILLTHLLLNL